MSTGFSTLLGNIATASPKHLKAAQEAVAAIEAHASLKAMDPKLVERTLQYYLDPARIKNAGAHTAEAVLKDLQGVKKQVASVMGALIKEPAATTLEIQETRHVEREMTRQAESVATQNKVAASMSLLIAGLSALGAFSHFRHSVVEGEDGKRHIQPNQLGMGIVMSLLTAGSLFFAAEGFKAPAATR